MKSWKVWVGSDLGKTLTVVNGLDYWDAINRVLGTFCGTKQVSFVHAQACRGTK